MQKVLEQKKRPIQMTILITNDGIRLVQMSQIRKRDFVQTDHVSFIFSTGLIETTIVNKKQSSIDYIYTTPIFEVWYIYSTPCSKIREFFELEIFYF